MSDMSGNPHIPDALMQLRQATAGSINAAHASAILAAAQTNATLALAYETRTANLITLFHGMGDTRQEFMDATAIEFSDWDRLAQQIASRLGLNEGATK